MKPFFAGLCLLFASAVAHCQPTSGSLTLATYNIHSGIPNGHNSLSYYPGASDMQNIADVLTTTAASIIALQEVRNVSPPPAKFRDQSLPVNMPLHLAGILRMHYAFASTLDAAEGYPENRTYLEWGTADKWTNNAASHGEYGNAVLSKFDITTPTVIPLPRGNEEAQKRGDEPRNAIRVQLEVPGLGKTVIYSTHFQHNNGTTREAQMKHLLEQATKDAASATVFIMGDLNHFPRPGEPNLLGLVKSAGFHDLAAEFAAAGNSSPEPTMNEHIVKVRIDYILCSRPLKVTDVKVLQTNVSDHFPLAVTIAP